MIEFVFFLSIGIAILVLLVLLVQDRAPSRRDGVPLAELQDTLATLELKMPSPTLAKRIFALEDWDFVSRRTSPAVQRLFSEERKTLALSWLRNTRHTVGKLMDFHRRRVRGNAALNPLREVGLGLNYFFFLLVCNVLLGMIWAVGPFRARAMALFAADRAEQIAYVFGGLVSRLGPAFLHNLKGSGLGRSTAL